MEDLTKYTLLVVDDEEDLRKSMIFDFKRKGFTVLSAENGTKALEIVKANQVHLVISDIRMPDGDGITLLDGIRAHDPETPPVILVTGYSDVSEADCIARGARKVISKPFERKALMDSAVEALSSIGRAK